MPDLKQLEKLIGLIDSVLKRIFPNEIPPLVSKLVGYILLFILALFVICVILHALKKIKTLFKQLFSLPRSNKEKQRARRRRRFADHIESEIRRLNNLEAWSDYRYEVRLRPHCGQRHRILFRVRGAQRSYAFGLAPDGRVCFEKNWQGYVETASAPLAWELQQEVKVGVEVVGSHMTGLVDGEKVLEWTDPGQVWSSGCVGLGVRNGRTLFLSAALRPVS